MNKGRRYAVLIGSSRFDKEPNLNPLKCPENDVDGMREILAAAELGAFEEPSVFKNADSFAVMHRIEETLSEATGADQVLIYYSGHGKTDLPGRLYLATANTEIKKLVTTSIPIETLRLLIENSSCRKIMLILDCCYGGAVGRSFTRGDVDDKFKELARGNGVYILTASTASQTAQEREGDDYGLLTKHIISGIRQGDADADADGLVSMDDLYQYVYAKVKSEGYQEPMRWALNVKGEDLIIARASGVSIREQQRLLTEKIIEIRSFLPSRIFTKAIQVIEDRRGPLYEIVFKLHREQWEVGRFIEEWDQVEAGERSQPPASAPPPSQPASPAASATTTAPKKPAEGELPTSFTENLKGVELTMILVPGGRFKMGSPYGQGDNDERPEREVAVPGFYIGKYQVTQAQWKAVMGSNPSHFKGAGNLPVECVSWNDAKEFCKNLSRMTGNPYRLPSEAEWEYACRAGMTGDYAGNLDEMAWYNGNSESKTHPVGGKQPNALGLYDMHGNVWEWCEDVWHDDYKGAPSDGAAWLSGGNPTRRVLRGGSWYNNGGYCRSAVRVRYGAGDRLNYLGFRVVVAARTR